MWQSLLSLFAAPLGAIINKALAVGGASLVTWAVSKGLPADSAATIGGALIVAASTAISGFASSQGVQIPLINADPNNGVKVVASTASAPAVNSPLK
jgi:hypothetical protein